MALVRLRPPHDTARDEAQRLSALGVEAFVVLVALSALGALIAVGHDWAAPHQREVEIDLSLWALPKYTLFTLSRGLIAFAFSFVFTVAYGTLAARSRRASSATFSWLVTRAPPSPIAPRFLVG